MNEQERNEANHLTALQGEALAVVGGFPARHISLEALSVLDMCGSPIAAPIRAALNGQQPPPVASLRPQDLAILAWVFCAPEDDVLNTALDCAPNYVEPAVKAALKWTRVWPLSAVKEVLPHVERELLALRAAFFESAAPDYGQHDAKKNDTASAASPS